MSSVKFFILGIPNGIPLFMLCFIPIYLCKYVVRELWIEFINYVLLLNNDMLLFKTK